MLLVSAFLTGVAWSKAPADLPLLRIHLTNTRIVPAKILREAQDAAAKILTGAGVQVEWVDCLRTGCDVESGPWIQFVNLKQLGSHADAAGYTVLYPTDTGKAGYAVVAWKPVEAVAQFQGFDPGPLLGAAIVHEIGHLVLGDSHSRRGVMVPRFRRREIEQAERGELRFLDEEAARIREAAPVLATRR